MNADLILRIISQKTTEVKKVEKKTVWNKFQLFFLISIQMKHAEEKIYANEISFFSPPKNFWIL